MKHLLLVPAAALLAGVTSAQTILPPFNNNYSYVDLGTVAGVPANYGGLMFSRFDPNTLLLCGSANNANGTLYRVPLIRDPNGHVSGFGTPTVLSTAPNNDGGLDYGPGQVILFTQYSNNGLGMIKPGSTAPDKTVNLGSHGIANSVGTCRIVPPGYAAAGRFKVASYNAGTWYDVTLQPDGQGTFNVGTVNPGITIGGGPEGILYPPAGSPLLPDYSRVLINEYSGGNVVVWNVDANGDPLTGTRQVFMSGLSGAEGATLDPVTNDFLFTTYGGGNRIIQVRGFGSCGAFTNYGAGSPGLNNVIPTIGGLGCPRVAGALNIQVRNGRPLSFGFLVLGFQQTSIPMLNFTLLTNASSSYPHALSTTGSLDYLVVVPPLSVWGNLNTYWQAGYLDSGAPQGISTTNGLQMFIQ